MGIIDPSIELYPVKNNGGIQITNRLREISLHSPYNLDDHQSIRESFYPFVELNAYLAACLQSSARFRSLDTKITQFLTNAPIDTTFLDN